MSTGTKRASAWMAGLPLKRKPVAQCDKVGMRNLLCFELYQASLGCPLQSNSMHLLSIALCLALIAAANAAPPAAAIVFGRWFAWPIDGGTEWPDGRPLFGRSKTLRGIIVAIAAGALVGWLIGLPWMRGAAAALSAMAGDLLSSFCKRRLGLSPSAPALGLDQLPESFLPALVCAGPLGMSWSDTAVVVPVFSFGDLIISPHYRRWRFPWEARPSSGQ